MAGSPCWTVPSQRRFLAPRLLGASAAPPSPSAACVRFVLAFAGVGFASADVTKGWSICEDEVRGVWHEKMTRASERMREESE